jgi:hypothetical protein
MELAVHTPDVPFHFQLELRAHLPNILGLSYYVGGKVRSKHHRFTFDDRAWETRRQEFRTLIAPSYKWHTSYYLAIRRSHLLSQGMRTHHKLAAYGAGVNSSSASADGEIRSLHVARA